MPWWRIGMGWWRKAGKWPGFGPFCHLPPWKRPGWIFGRGRCWSLYLGRAPKSFLPATSPRDEISALEEYRKELEDEKASIEEELREVERRIKELKEKQS